MTAEYTTPQPGEPDSLEADFADLARILTRLDEDAAHRLDQADDDLAALELLYDLREARKQLQRLEATVEATAAQRMTGPKVQWPGFIAERKGGVDRKAWEHDRLAWAVVQPLAADANGEIDDAAADLIGRVRDRLLNCAAISYWRAGQLRQLGVDPDSFCQRTPGRRTVIVTPAVDG